MLIKSLLSLFILSTFLISCNQKEKIETNINSYENAVLVSSHKTAFRAIEDILGNLEYKTHKPETRDTAFVYKPKADSVVALGKNMTDYLDTLLERINKNEKLDDKDSLFEKLKIFEAELVKIDTRKDVFGNSILDIDTLMGLKNMNRNEFNSQFLNIASHNQTEAFLNSLEEDVLHAEIEMLHYLDLYCGYRGCSYDAYNAIITQSSEQLKPNHILELAAGIGKFEFHPNAKFIVGNKEVPIDSTDGIAVYKMRVSNEKGKHKVRVKLSWTKPNGKPILLEKEIVYSVE